jgi:hypothetical protein
MGITREKVTYKCDCGVDWGSCGAECAFVFVNNRSVDVYQIFHIDTHEYKGGGKDKPMITEVLCCSDNELNALIAILTGKHTNVELTELEKKMCRP